MYMLWFITPNNFLANYRLFFPRGSLSTNTGFLFPTRTFPLALNENAKVRCRCRERSWLLEFIVDNSYMYISYIYIYIENKLVRHNFSTKLMHA